MVCSRGALCVAINVISCYSSSSSKCFHVNMMALIHCNSIALTKINRLMIRNSSFELINYWINLLSQVKVTKSSLSIPPICKMDQDIKKMGVILSSPSDDKKHASLCWAWIIILIKKKNAINFSSNSWYTQRDWNSNENAKYWRKKKPQEIKTIWP